MRSLKFLALVAVMLLGASCASVRVQSDYDSAANFQQIKTYAFLKEGVDQLKISDLDKKRILKAVDVEMMKKGFTKSEQPDVVINLFSESQKNVAVHNYYGGWGYRPWGWNPYMWGGYATTTTSTEGVLYIDILTASNKELIWQGKGTGYLTSNRAKKEARIQEFAEKILTNFPPQSEK